MDGEAVIEFYQDPTLTIGPAIMRSILNRFMDGMAGVKIAVNVFLDEANSNEYAMAGQVVQLYLKDSLAESDDPAGELLDVRAPANSQKNEAEESQNLMLNIIGPIMGGMMVFYAFYTGTSVAQSILKEEEEQTLPRLFTTPTSQATILTGKLLSVFMTVSVQVVVLLDCRAFDVWNSMGQYPVCGFDGDGNYSHCVVVWHLRQFVSEKHQTGRCGLRRCVDRDRHDGHDQNLCHELSHCKQNGRHHLFTCSPGLGNSWIDAVNEWRADQQRVDHCADCAGVERGIFRHRCVAFQQAICVATGANHDPHFRHCTQRPVTVITRLQDLHVPAHHANSVHVPLRLCLWWIWRETNSNSRLPVGYISQDDNWITDELHDLLANSEVIRLEEYTSSTPSDLEKLVADGDLAAAIIVQTDMAGRS